MARSQPCAVRPLDVRSDRLCAHDLLNHVLSCNVDRLWWRRVAAQFPARCWPGPTPVGSGRMLREPGDADVLALPSARWPKNGRPVRWPAGLRPPDAGAGERRNSLRPRGGVALSSGISGTPLYFPARLLDRSASPPPSASRNLVNYRGGVEEFSPHASAGRGAGNPRLQRAGRRCGQAVCALLPPGSSRSGLAGLGGLRTVPLSSLLGPAVPGAPGIAANHAIGGV